MKKNSTFSFSTGTLILSLVSVFFLNGASLYAQEEAKDKSQSPYFFVMSKDTSIDQMPLKSTSADVMISGMIANVTVKQTYCNLGDSVLEAIYVFPASTRAAVHYMQMSLGYRILVAEIKEKQEARKIYEEAREEGKTVTLLEEDRPNVFKMSVGNILPGDTVEVEMRYTELLEYVGGEYEFLYPTVVGPRYVSPSENGESWTETPYQHEGEDPLYDFHFGIRINAGMEIRDVYSPSNPELEFSPAGTESVKGSADLKGNRDVVVKYSLSGAEIETGMLTYEGEDENFFLAMFQPPKNPQDRQIPPREYVFIMDVSGSMSGFPIEVSRTLLIDLVGGLREQDRFNLVFFAGGNYTLAASSLPATEENIARATEAIDNKSGGGGTELLSALQSALDLPGTENYSRTFVIATDGYVSVERKAFELIRNNLDKANFFAFGIGSSCNRYLIEGIARTGMGEPAVVLNQSEAADAAHNFRKYIEFPVLTNIRSNFIGFDAYDVEPPGIPDVFVERPVIIFGKYHTLSGSIGIKGLSGKELYMDNLAADQYPADPENEALRYLWARYRIRYMDDYGLANSYYYDENSPFSDSLLAKEITELGLKYNLLTRFTSFVAVDSMVRTDSGSAVTVTQPLPLPEGVSDQAVGDRVNSPYGWTSSFGGLQTNSLRPAEGSQKVSRLEQPFPNPFDAGTFIRFFLEKPDLEKQIRFELYNSIGRIVDIIEVDAPVEGWQEIYLDIRGRLPDLGAGVYTAVLMIGDNRHEPRRLLYQKR